MDSHDDAEETFAKLIIALIGMLGVIHVILGNLPEPVRLQRHNDKDDMAERLADDLYLVREYAISSQPLDEELAAFISALLEEWIIAFELVTLIQRGGMTPRRLAALDYEAVRTDALIDMIRDSAPRLLTRPAGQEGDGES